MKRNLFLILFIGVILVSCSSAKSEQDTSFNDPNEMALAASKAHHKAIESVHAELNTKGSEDEMLDRVDQLLDESKQQLLSYSNKAMTYEQADYEVYTNAYQSNAFEGIDSVMIDIAHYRDSLIKNDPGNLLAIVLQDFLSVGVYASPEMMLRVVPSEFEKHYGKLK